MLSLLYTAGELLELHLYKHGVFIRKTSYTLSHKTHIRKVPLCITFANHFVAIAKDKQYILHNM